jgi:membrane associated rhomboid family serine protease
MPSCLKCGAELAVNEEGIAPVLCDRCAGRATSRARRGLRTGTLLDFPATAILMAINIGAFLAMPLFGVNPFNPSGIGLIRMGANYGPLTVGGEYWRLLTAGFLHGGFLHIAMNMWCLWMLGRMAEHLFGKWQTFCIYLITGVGGALLSIAYDPGRLEVGASGALFGIAGTVIAGLKFGDLPISWREQRATISSVGMFVVLSLIWGASSPNTDNMCHLGGFFSGLLLGLPLGAFARKHKLLQLATILVTSVVLFAAGRELVQTHGAEGQLYRVSMAIRQRDFTEATAILEKYTLANPDNDRALVTLGDLYARTNRPDKAIAAYQQALKVNPNSSDAQEALDEMRSNNRPQK